MPTIARSALVSHSAADMYALVCDIESYPHFLPWCDAASISEQSDKHQIATVVVDRRLRGIQFTTRNTLEPNEAIHLGLVNGPFKRLNGVWRFKSLADDACRVELHMEFEFSSRLLGTLLGPAFAKICDSMVQAFVRRADQLQ